MATKEKVGVVVSNAANKTCIVAVDARITHKKYGKVVIRTKRYAVHDVEFNSGIGDRVRIRETRPLSKKKTWILSDILRKSST